MRAQAHEEVTRAGWIEKRITLEGDSEAEREFLAVFASVARWGIGAVLKGDRLVVSAYAPLPGTRKNVVDENAETQTAKR